MVRTVVPVAPKMEVKTEAVKVPQVVQKAPVVVAAPAPKKPVVTPVKKKEVAIVKRALPHSEQSSCKTRTG